MSYAAVTAEHVSGYQPQANPALLNLEPATTSLPDVDSKVTVVEPGFKEHPATVTSETDVHVPPLPEDVPPPPPKKESKKDKVKFKASEVKDKAEKYFEEAEEEGAHLWVIAKQKLLQPGVLGGILGVVNLGILGAGGYLLYSRPALRTDYRTLGVSGAAVLALFTGEGFLADAYRKTDAGQAEEKQAREEGALLYKHTKEVVLRPGVLGGIVGVLNLGILGGVGYVAYTRWGEKWDRRIVSAISVGLVSLAAGEGFLAELYKEKELPKRK